MNQVNLTTSQEKAIEDQKRIARMIYGNDVNFNIWQPRNTDIVRLTACWTTRNHLGGEIKRSTSWTIGKRGKVDND